jgi:hypothetical protein
MPRTFTLAGLMLGITVFCVLCGLAVSKNEKAIAYTLTIASLTPAALVCLTLVSFSRRRKTVLICSIIGATIGSSFGFPIFGGGGSMTVWQAIGPVFMPIAISSALGALLFGGVALALDPPDSPFPPEEP